MLVKERELERPSELFSGRNKESGGGEASAALFVRELKVWGTRKSALREVPRNEAPRQQQLAVAEVFDVNVGAEADVIGQVPTVVIGIVVDDDLVGVPEPIVAVAGVKRADAEIKAVEPEAAGTAATEMPDMASANAAAETAMLPGMVEMEAGIIVSGVVADPFAVGVNVRGFGMAFLVIELGMIVAMFGWCWACWSVVNGRRAMPRNVAASHFGLTAATAVRFLGESWSRKNQAQCENSEK